MTHSKNELVIVNSSSDTMLIDARLLHQQLQSGQRFADWIKKRINEFDFEENEDFFIILGKSIFGRKPVDYHLTMDMAKELAMLERNSVGKRIRQYFIAVEKEAREASKTGRILPKGVKSRSINGRKLYPYARMSKKLGFKSGGGLYSRRYRYPNHFIKLDSLWYCTEEMANLMAMWKSTINHRQVIKEMNPILPLDFGAPIQMLGGRSK